MLAFLLDPKSYPHHPRHVRAVQTHASHVFFAGPFVYKVKKPVDFGFLDYSTLELRREFCEREVALNRRLCPDVYLGVVPISIRHGRLAFGEEGVIVEYAVKMRKLARRYFLDRLVERGVVVSDDLDRIVAKLTDFYLAQAPSVQMGRWGELDHLKISTDENLGLMRSFIGRTVSESSYGAIRGFTENFYVRHSALFRSRVKGNWIRDCHGDLHLEHIHLTSRKLHIYDCIEFNDRLRYLDVANDVAFLAMDFDYEGRPDLSRLFATKMASALRDVGMLELMDFYKCYRACVRGKVESLRGSSGEVSAADREASIARAKRYFRLALRYALTGSCPTALVVMGRIASGKSTLARGLGGELGCPVVCSDQERKLEGGVPLSQRGDARARAKLYSARMTTKTYERILDRGLTELQTGGNVVLDATFSRSEQRAELKRRLSRAGLAYCFIEVQASDGVVKGRLAQRDRAKDEISDARLEDFGTLMSRYQSPEELRSLERVVVKVDGPAEATLAETLKALVQRNLEDGGRCYD
jgi:aminoglycoside phosphotransferase family enzyme/predicted kinase